MFPLDTAPISLAPDDILAIAASVYAGLSEPDIQAVEQIAADRQQFPGGPIEPAAQNHPPQK
jgi:hypothetical protein